MIIKKKMKVCTVKKMVTKTVKMVAKTVKIEFISKKYKLKNNNN